MATAEVTTERPGSPEEAAKLLRSLGEAGKGVRPRGGGTKLDWGGIGEPVAVELETGRDGEDPRAQRRRPHRGAAGRRAAGRGAGRVRRGGPDARARPAAGEGRRGDRRRHGRDRRLRPAAPPLRRRARPDRRHLARALGRQPRQGRQQGDQERRGLRPRQAVHRLLRDARADRDGHRATASQAGRERHRCGRDRRSRRAGAGRDPARAAAARGRLARRRLAGRLRAPAGPLRRRHRGRPGRGDRQADARRRARRRADRRGRRGPVGRPARRAAPSRRRRR